jgi:curved DNA-binding protein CbpA
MRTPDYYAMLQVDPRADPEVIEAAYRRLARKWHPDANANPEAAAMMQQLNEAYEVLRDPARRRAHDAARRSRGQPSTGASRRTTVPIVASGIGLALAVIGLGALRLFSGLLRSPLVLLIIGLAVYWVWRSWRRQGQVRKPSA